MGCSARCLSSMRWPTARRPSAPTAERQQGGSKHGKAISSGARPHRDRPGGRTCRLFELDEDQQRVGGRRRSVEYRPNDASFRALLGNIYLASGRYASAERSYHDALTLAAPDPQVVLKYA